MGQIWRITPLILSLCFIGFRLAGLYLKLDILFFLLFHLHFGFPVAKKLYVNSFTFFQVSSEMCFAYITYFQLRKSNIFSRVCLLEDTGPQYFKESFKFYKFDVWTTKEIQIIHRSFLAIAMYYWVPSMNHLIILSLSASVSLYMFPCDKWQFTRKNNIWTSLLATCINESSTPPFLRVVSIIG